MKIAVIGMGKIGLPLAVQYARKGHDVIGVDINRATVDSINQGIEPFPEEAHLQDFLSEVVASRKLKATLSYEEAVSDADTIVVVVPLFINDKAEPNFKAIDSATENIGRYMKKNSLICYETTLPIGTTRERFTPALEVTSGLKVGRDFGVVFSPERVLTGRIFEDLRKYPKILGGVTTSCTEKGIHFYKVVLDFDERIDLARPNGVWNVQSVESAEFVKLAETTYRDVNIALANQFARFADLASLNIYEIIESANSQPHSRIHKPGLSVGGHCIPIYPHFYLLGDQDASIVRVARDLNASMPSWVVQKIQKLLGDLSEKRIVIYGVSYRENVKETYNSGAIEIYEILRSFNAKVSVYDSLFSPDEVAAMGLQPYIQDDSEIDMVILHSYNAQFPAFVKAIFDKIKIVLDGGDWLRNHTMFDNRKIICIGKPELSS